MLSEINYFLNKATEAELGQFFNSESNQFWGFLEASIDRISYIKKIFDKAIKFEAWCHNELIGVLAFYCNDKQYLTAYITAVSVLEKFQRKGVSSELIKHCISYVQNQGMSLINLQVLKSNFKAIESYKKFGFKANESDKSIIQMTLNL